MVREDLATEKREHSGLFLAIMLAVVLVMSFVPVPSASAASTSATDVFAKQYCSTWEEYQNASNLQSPTWNDVADAMDEVLKAAVEKYEAGDAKGAYDCINDGYYGYYETTGFERIAMSYISGSRKTEMELQFSTCKAVTKNGGSVAEFQQECDTLSSMLREDANRLDGTSSSSSGSFDDDGIAEDLFASNYYSTWDEYLTASGLGKDVTWNDVADAMDQVIKTGMATYADGDAQGAYNCINDAYYGYYETTGFERIAMSYISGSRKTEMELQFSACKAVTKNGGSVDEFNAECETLMTMLNTDANLLDGTSGDESDGGAGGAMALTSFLGAFGIILREGFEAILVVGAIIAYLHKQNAPNKKRSLRQVYLGAILGIVFSFVMAWLLSLLNLANSASQEIIEGCTALFACAVMFWVSNWMVSKSESESWNRYIKGRVESSTSKGSAFALAFTAWLAVFREGAEVILFFQPMLSNGDPTMVWVGFGVGCVVLVFVYLAIRLIGLKLPLKPFFLATSILMFIMCVAFLGSGIKELIEGDVFVMWAPDWVTWIPNNDVLQLFGIYPCGQTVVAQLIMIVVVLVCLIFWLRRNKRLRLEAEADGAVAAVADVQDAPALSEQVETLETGADDAPGSED